MSEVTIVGCWNCTSETGCNKSQHCPLNAQGQTTIMVGLQGERDKDIVSAYLGNFINQGNSAIHIMECDGRSGVIECTKSTVFKIGANSEVLRGSKREEEEWNEHPCHLSESKDASAIPRSMVGIPIQSYEKQTYL